MSYIMVDIEADGPIPGDFSMICFGAVVCEAGLTRTFYRRVRPISDKWVPEALAVSGFSRDDTLGGDFQVPTLAMFDFKEWIKSITDKPRFIADNNGFDWQFINWYFHHFLNENPFGYSSTNLGSLWKGIAKTMKSSFKHMRHTKHDHNPVNDAKGNAEAFLRMKTEYGLVIE